MTSNEIAQREVPADAPAIVQAVPNPNTDSWALVIRPITALANQVAETEFVPKALRNKPEAVAAAILFGRELDMPPMHALTGIHMVEGRPTLAAETMRAQVLAAGHEIGYGEISSSKVEVKGRRRGETQWTVIPWTIADATRAGIAKKTVWINYPRQMLAARATAELCRLIFPDVTHGMRATEEMEDFDGGETMTGGGVAAVESGTTKVSRAARGSNKSRGVASDAGSAAAVPGPPPATPRAAEIPPPPPPAAPASEPVKKPDTTAEDEKALDRFYGVPEGDYSTEEIDEHGQEFIPEAVWADAEAAAEQAQAESGPVDPAPKPMHTAQTKALQARFKGLGFTDEPDDREARLRVASTILGRGEADQVETFRATGDGAMTYDEADQVMRVLAPCRSRDDVIALLVKIAQDAAAEEDGS